MIGQDRTGYDRKIKEMKWMVRIGYGMDVKRSEGRERATREERI